VSTSDFPDFTRAEYRSLLRLARRTWKFRGFTDFNASERFILWRHDVDFSLQSAVNLGQIEADEGVRSTFFFHLHNEFYNLLEPGTTRLARKIAVQGHRVGLHFDSHYHQIENEEHLDEAIEWEAGILRRIVGDTIDAFSFHNTSAFTMSCRRWTYGGLINTYAKYFQDDVGYISDSNGYWRYRNLREVVEAATDERLQVLTHPGWWQDQSMAPREKVWRCITGRAASTIRGYDRLLAIANRENMRGPAEHLVFLRRFDGAQYRFLDRLWNERLFPSVFLELYRLHERQIRRLCSGEFVRQAGQSTSALNLSRTPSPVRTVLEMFSTVFGDSWEHASGSNKEEHARWMSIGIQLMRGEDELPGEQLEKGCIYLCSVIQNIAEWGLAKNALNRDGITALAGLGVAADGKPDEPELLP